MLRVAVAQRWNQIQQLAHAAGVVCLPTTSWPESQMRRSRSSRAKQANRRSGAPLARWPGAGCLLCVGEAAHSSSKCRSSIISFLRSWRDKHDLHYVTAVYCTRESPSFSPVLDCNTLRALEHGNVSMGRCVCSTGYFGAQRALTAASAPLSAVFGTGVLDGLVAIVCTQAACLYSPCRVVCSCKAFGKEGYQALRLVCDAGCALSRVKAHARPLVHNAEDEWATRVMVDDMDHNLHMNNRCVPCVALCPRGAVLCHGL